MADSNTPPDRVPFEDIRYELVRRWNLDLKWVKAELLAVPEMVKDYPSLAFGNIHFVRAAARHDVFKHAGKMGASLLSLDHLLENTEKIYAILKMTEAQAASTNDPVKALSKEFEAVAWKEVLDDMEVVPSYPKIRKLKNHSPE